MAAKTLNNVAQFFPAGATVGAYKRSGWSTGAPPTRGTAPPASADATASVAADGTLAFTGLSSSTEYVAGAQVSGVWTFVQFRTGVAGYGLLADRPAVSRVADGYTYFATDDNGGTEYQAQNGAWAIIGGKGVELEYAEITSTPPGITVETAIAGLDSFTVAFRDRPVELKVDLPLATNNTAARNVQAKLYDITGGGNTLVSLANVWCPTANQGGPIRVRREIPAQTPGTQKTYKVTIVVPNGGTATVFADPTFPASIQAVEV